MRIKLCNKTWLCGGKKKKKQKWLILNAANEKNYENIESEISTQLQIAF